MVIYRNVTVFILICSNLQLSGMEELVLCVELRRYDGVLAVDHTVILEGIVMAKKGNNIYHRTDGRWGGRYYCKGTRAC